VSTLMPDLEPTIHDFRLGRIEFDKNQVDFELDGVAAYAKTEFGDLLKGLPDAPAAAAELVHAAVAAWVADRSVSRAEQWDRWRRHIVLRFPVTDPRSWPTETLQDILRFISNDAWVIEPYEAATPPTFAVSQKTLAPDEADAVRLFSGGLDSFAYAVADGTHCVLSVGHFDMPTLRGIQQRLHRRLNPDSTRFRPFRVSRDDPSEKSSRTRGLLFATTAIAVAAATGVETVAVPENGFVALNVPLTPARSGALSTRSTHPHTLALINQLAGDLGLKVGLRNPWLYATKGDIAAEALKLPDAAALTVSCSHPTADRWQGDSTYRNCGYCYPCLVRRSGIEAANGGQDPTVYGHDPRKDKDIYGSVNRRADIFAVVASLGRPPRHEDLLATGPLPPEINRDDLQAMRERSHDELSTMLTNGMTREVRQTLGL